MARVNIPDQNRDITDPHEMRTFLQQYGIKFEQWDVDGRIGADATNEEILAAYEPEIERLKTERADVANASAQKSWAS
jgi:1,2-dihydroxy-3-keto-5-methylthiopentene dioxygenase